MANINKYYINEEGVKQLASDILSKVYVRITEKITSTYDKTDEVNAVTGKAVADAIKELSNKVDGLTHLHIETVVGEITSVADPDTAALYFQKDNEDDPTWVMYIYKDAQWIGIGDTSVDLANYWKKTDIEEMKTALGIVEYEAISNEAITAAVEAAFAETAPTTTTTTEEAGA